MQTGAQLRIAPNWFLSGSIAYESSDFRGDGGIAKVNGDSLLLGATLRYQNGPWKIFSAVARCQADAIAGGGNIAIAAKGGKELPRTRPQALCLVWAASFTGISTSSKTPY
jgi:hypothetical protein